MSEQQQQPTSSAIVLAAPEAAADRGGGREYRKGNWTLQETMVLINAKKMDDERRLKGVGDKEKGKTAEFRWKWVENFCWKNGCHRSQNQCNDKWDNLLRDYKKVREHENKLEPGQKSYWTCEKHERKEKGLPSNMMIGVYDALHEVVDKRPSSSRPMLQQQQQQQSQQQPQQQQQIQLQEVMFGASGSQQQLAPAVLQQQQPLLHQLPGAQQQQQQQRQQQQGQQQTEVSRSTESEGSRSPKRRKVSKGAAAAGASTAGAGAGSTAAGVEPLVLIVSRTAQELTQTLLACEERRDKRHRDLMQIEERKLKLEEARTEINRQCMESLTTAVNNVAAAILNRPAAPES